ncbi:MAG: VOC family protein [Bacteroidota bacterium]|jgi:predicted 3-demethylubiquinone-9 3-methyltransferase (glyoxalase superfamily)
MSNKLYPCLWFDGQAKAAAEFYCSVFKDSKILSVNPMAVVFEINQSKFMALNGGPEYKFSAANSYIVTCDTQEEIDYYWNQFGREGQPGKCGWMIDKYGVSWQIVPSILGSLMNDPEKAPKVMYAFMQMSKFEIEKLINA